MDVLELDKPPPYAPAAKALVGRCAGKTTTLDGAQFNVKPNPRNFAVLTLDSFDGRPLSRSRRLLLAAAGDVENTGMGWNANHTSVGTHWGTAPTICEGIAAHITLATTAHAARVYALDAGDEQTRIPQDASCNLVNAS